MQDNSSRFRIQSVTNSERRPELRKMWVFVGVSERGGSAGEYKSGHPVCGLPRVPMRTHIHTPRLPSTLPPSRSGVPVRFCPLAMTATYRKSPQRMCGHSRSIGDLLRRDGIVYSVSLFRAKHGSAASPFLMKSERPTLLSDKCVLNSKPSKFRRIYSPPPFPHVYLAYVSAVTAITIGNCRRRAESPSPFTSAKLSGLIARKIRPDFGDLISLEPPASLKRFKVRESAGAGNEVATSNKKAPI